MGKSDKVKKVENAKEKLKKESGSRKAEAVRNAEAAPAAEPDGKRKWFRRMKRRSRCGKQRKRSGLLRLV